MEDCCQGSTDDVWAPTFAEPPIFFTEFAREGEEEAAEDAEQFFIGTPRRDSSPPRRDSPDRRGSSTSRPRLRHSMSRRSSKKSSQAVTRSNEEFFQGFEDKHVFKEPELPPEVAFPFAESHLLSRSYSQAESNPLSRSYSEDLGLRLQKQRQKERPQQPQRCSSQSALFDLWDTGSGSVSDQSSESSSSESSSEAGDNGSAELRVPLLGPKRRLPSLPNFLPAGMVSNPRSFDAEIQSTTWDVPLQDGDTDEEDEPFFERVSDSEACSSMLSPRTYDVLTNYGKAPDGAGILARLQEEVRRRAHNAWLFTGNEIASDNWLQAERSMVITGHRAAKVRHSSLPRESRIARQMSTRIRDLQKKLRKKDEILRAKDARIQELERAVVAQGAVIAAMSMPGRR